MTTVYLLQNQDQLLLNKQGEWVDGREAGSLYRSPYKDEALNQMVEVNSKDYTLRIRILECEVSERGVPLIKEEDLPPLGLVRSEPPAANDADSAEEESRPLSAMH